VVTVVVLEETVLVVDDEVVEDDVVEDGVVEDDVVEDDVVEDGVVVVVEPAWQDPGSPGLERTVKAIASRSVDVSLVPLSSRALVTVKMKLSFAGVINDEKLQRKTFRFAAMPLPD